MDGKRIYLERIDAMACRDYRCLTGKHEFRFIDDVTQLRGSNGSGKTTILNLISLAFEPEFFTELRPFSVNESNGPSIIELDFQAGGKRHILYRCFREIENLSTYLTIIENDSFRELYDQEALDYLDQITLPHRLGYEDISHRVLITKGYRQMYPEKIEGMMTLINTWNCNRNSYIKHLYWQNGQINFVDLHGSNQRFESSASGPKTLICNMMKLAKIIHDKFEGEVTKVVLIDDMLRMLSHEHQEDMIGLIKILSDKHGIQFITTDNIPGVSKSFQLDRPAIPSIYRTKDHQLLSNRWSNKYIHKYWSQTTHNQRKFKWKV